MVRLISFVWPERRPWITDAWYIAWPADAIFALVPMATTASLCFFSAFDAHFPSMTCFTLVFTWLIGYNSGLNSQREQGACSCLDV
jgi:hypothetical protein